MYVYAQVLTKYTYKAILYSLCDNYFNKLSGLRSTIFEHVIYLLFEIRF